MPDKWVTMVSRAGVDTPRATLVTVRNYDQIESSAARGWRSRSSSSPP
ncbi:MAG: hypothetical protein R2939_13880 [Kofleriaceae bacterium]